MTLLPVFFTIFACSDVKEDDHHHEHNHGVVDAVTVSLTDSGGSTEDVEWQEGSTSTINLVAGESYNVALTFYVTDHGEQESLNPELIEFDDEHQVFFTGDAVLSDSPIVEVSYADSDGNGLPLGLENTFQNGVEGQADLMITLRHMPPENDVAVKTADDAANLEAADGDFSVVGGSNDVQVTFDLVGSGN